MRLASRTATPAEAQGRRGGARTVAVAATAGLGMGGLLHRLLVAVFERLDRLAVAPDAPAAGARDDLLRYGPWIAIGVAAAVLALTWSGEAWLPRVRSASAIAIGVAGVAVAVIGELELHVFRTLAQRWPAHDLAWDVAFHLPGEAIALAGWVLLPARRRGRRPSQRA